MEFVEVGENLGVRGRDGILVFPVMVPYCYSRRSVQTYRVLQKLEGSVSLLPAP